MDVLLGFLVDQKELISAVLVATGTASLLWIGQFLTDRRTARREVFARKEEFRLRGLSIERETGIALQEALLEHHKRLLKSEWESFSMEDLENFRGITLDLRVQVIRLVDEDVRGKVEAYIHASEEFPLRLALKELHRQATEDLEMDLGDTRVEVSTEGLENNYREAQEAIGNLFLRIAKGELSPQRRWLARK